MNPRRVPQPFGRPNQPKRRNPGVPRQLQLAARPRSHALRRLNFSSGPRSHLLRQLKFASQPRQIVLRQLKFASGPRQIVLRQLKFASGPRQIGFFKMNKTFGRRYLPFGELHKGSQSAQTGRLNLRRPIRCRPPAHFTCASTSGPHFMARCKSQQAFGRLGNGRLEMK